MNINTQIRLATYFKVSEITFLIEWLNEDLLIDKKIDKGLTTDTIKKMKSIISELKTSIKDRSI